MPVVIANGILLVINIIQMVRLYKIQEAFDLLQIGTHDELISCFIKRNKKILNLIFRILHISPIQQIKLLLPCATSLLPIYLSSE